VSTPAVEVLPRRPHASARGALRASQRGRLLCAIADAVAERGYAATSVADVIARAGVSRKTFYVHFEDKEACFLASYDVGADAIHAALAESVAGLEDWEEVLDAALGTWLAVLASDLAFTRAYMVEVWAAGDAARERWKVRRDRTEGLLRALHARIRAQDPRVAPVSGTQVAAVVGGVNRVMLSHVLGGDPRPLTALKPELDAFVRRNLASVEAPS
jgi:AcrR family transcriptional regulator